MSSNPAGLNATPSGSLVPELVLKQREFMKNAEAQKLEALGPAPDGLEEYWTSIKIPDGWESKTKVIRPKDLTSSRKHPLIVFFYGGGYFAGSPNQITVPARKFAEAFEAVVVCPSYRHAPEAPWPTPVRDGWDVLEYFSKNGETEFGANLSGPNGGFVVAGVSAGASHACVAAAISMYGDGTETLKQFEKPLTGAFAMIPLTLTEEIVPQEYKSLWTSREDNKNAEGLNSAVVDQIRSILRPDVHSPWFSPFNALKNKEPARKVPVCVHACGLDPLRDDGILFHKALAARGIPTKLTVFPDDGHNAWLMEPFEEKSKNPTIP